MLELWKDRWSRWWFIWKRQVYVLTSWWIIKIDSTVWDFVVSFGEISAFCEFDVNDKYHPWYTHSSVLIWSIKVFECAFRVVTFIPIEDFASSYASFPFSSIFIFIVLIKMEHRSLHSAFVYFSHFPSCVTSWLLQRIRLQLTSYFRRKLKCFTHQFW